MPLSTEQSAAGRLEEIGRRDHEITSEYRIFGPPGTGKTTSLTRQIQRAVDRFGPDAVLVTSFSRAAAAELAGRDLPISSDRVGTLHSHCWHALGGPEVAEANVDDWNKANPHLAITPQRKQGKLDGEEAVEDSDQEKAGDALLEQLGRFRGLMLPTRVWPANLLHFDRLWSAYKRDNGLLDFTDLIETVLHDVAMAPKNPAVIFADEAQDLNRMQLSLVRKWGERASYFIVAGDDDQTIYSFTGATPEAFLKPEIPEDHKIILKQSYRDPRAVHRFAEALIRKVTLRQAKEYLPRPDDGALERLSKVDTYHRTEYEILKAAIRHIERGQTVMFLVSCSYMLHPLIAVLRKEGIPFHNPYRRSNRFWNPIRLGARVSSASRVLSLLVAHSQFSDGDRPWTNGDLAQWAEALQAKGILRHGIKGKLKAADVSRPVSMDRLVEIFEPAALDSLMGAMEGDYRCLLEWWRTRLTTEMTARAKYPIEVAVRGGPKALLDKPQIIVGTRSIRLKAARPTWCSCFPISAGRAMRSTPTAARRATRSCASSTLAQRAPARRFTSAARRAIWRSICSRAAARKRLKLFELPMNPTEGTLLMWLTGGPQLKQRVQHPDVHEREDRGTYYWYFRYRDDVIQQDGSLKTVQRFHKIGLSRPNRALLRRAGELESEAKQAQDDATRQKLLEEAAVLREQGTALSKRDAEGKRDAFFAERFAKAKVAPTGAEAPGVAKQSDDPGDVRIARLAELWRKDYVDNPKVKLAKPTREKYNDRLDNHILPKWKDGRLKDLNDSKAVLDWLHNTCSSWYMMIDLRNIISGMITRAQEWNVIPRSYANPMQWVKVGKQWSVREQRIYTPEETAWVFSNMSDPHLLICETCLYTGTRISEAVGLQLKHFDPEAGCIVIAQRHCRGDVDEPKTKNGKRVLALGALTERYKEWIAKKDIKDPNAWMFAQNDKHGGRQNGDPNQPMWDSGVRRVLKLAARACKPANADKDHPGLDFPGMGLHSFRRANISWRQSVGKATAIEASKIAGHGTLSMTGEYTFVPVERQEETTRPIQERMEKAKAKVVEIEFTACCEELHWLPVMVSVAKMNKAIDEVRAGESRRMAFDGLAPVLKKSREGRYTPWR
jgi:integrase